MEDVSYDVYTVDTVVPHAIAFYPGCQEFLAKSGKFLTLKYLTEKWIALSVLLYPQAWEKRHGS